MEQVVFADRLINASVHAGLVRLDLAVFAGTAQGREGKPGIQLEAEHQLVMPIDAFVAAVATQYKVLKELAVLEQRRGDAASAAAKLTLAETAS